MFLFVYTHTYILICVRVYRATHIYIYVYTHTHGGVGLFLCVCVCVCLWSYCVSVCALFCHMAFDAPRKAFLSGFAVITEFLVFAPGNLVFLSTVSAPFSVADSAQS